MCAWTAAAAAAVRVRYAPSPTGLLHLGGLRTALFNYLFAKKMGGQFLLRIEDTDRTREVPGSVENIITELRWCGLDYDEGPVTVASASAPCGFAIDKVASAPYIQSLHLDVFRDAAEELLRCDHAYRCFCTSERLDTLRAAQRARGLPTMYDRVCRGLSPAEAAAKAQSGLPFVVRLKVPSGTTSIDDCVVGSVRFTHDAVDDQVLLKSDGFPTYHLASVVDDHLMNISHVIRGQEWLSSTPKHVILYNALKWEVPRFAHLPLLLNTDKSKLSKRKGDVSVESFRNAGYLPSGLLNFVVFLGWNPKDTTEFMSLQDMVNMFSMEGTNKSNAVVDRSKLDWINGMHIRHASCSSETSLQLLHAQCSLFLKGKLKPELLHLLEHPGFVKDLVSIQHSRMSTLLDLVPAIEALFVDPDLTTPSTRDMVVGPCGAAAAGPLLRHVQNAIAGVPESETFGKDAAKAALSIATAIGIPSKKCMMTLRGALTGSPGGASLSEVMQTIGKQRTLLRVGNAADLSEGASVPHSEVQSAL